MQLKVSFKCGTVIQKNEPNTDENVQQEIRSHARYCSDKHCVRKLRKKLRKLGVACSKIIPV